MGQNSYNHEPLGLSGKTGFKFQCQCLNVIISILMDKMMS